MAFVKGKIRGKEGQIKSHIRDFHQKKFAWVNKMHTNPKIAKLLNIKFNI